MAEYKEAFLAEAREQMDFLTQGLLNLEKDPENSEYVHQVFRASHTLKGNAAMMGYNQFSELSHKMENLLQEIRDKRVKVNEEVINVLLEATDTLEDGLESISNKDVDLSDIDQIVGDLEAIMQPGEAKKESSIQKKLILDDQKKAKVENEKGSGNNVFRVVVTFSPTCQLKFPKAHLVSRKLEDISDEVIHQNPEDLKDVSKAFEIVISTGKSKDAVIQELSRISEIHVQVLAVDEDYQAPEFGSKREKKDDLKSLGKPIQSIKVDVKKLDNLVNIVGELLISNMRLRRISKEYESKELHEVVNNIDVLTDNIQDEVLQQRMVPVGQIFNRFPRLVRDISNKESKKIRLDITGEDIELDRNILDEISEPLVHLLRNSIDHGIEKPSTRVEANKPEEGVVQLSARREKNLAIIEVKDDGKGVDRDKVLHKAISKNIISEAKAKELSQEKILSLIFQPGISTSSNVTEISGRGVGMDVVLNKVKKLGGSVKVRSELGKGSAVEIKLPLTLAIISSLIVRSQQEKYAIPLTNIIETLELKSDTIRRIQGNEVISVRDEELPVMRLSKIFYSVDEEKQEYPTVIIEESEHKYALFVDEIISQQPILIKNLHPLIRGLRGIAGATILGDGKVCLILDTVSIAEV